MLSLQMTVSRGPVLQRTAVCSWLITIIRSLNDWTSNDTIKDYVDLQRGPYAVCLITKTEAAVSKDSFTAQILSLGTELTATNEASLRRTGLYK